MSARIGRCCAEALVAELSATPKPGLVDQVSNGAHPDMDYDLFQASIKVVGPFFAQLADVGCRLDQVDDDTLTKVRPIGIACETAMLRATGGVNTHKGAIFSLGLIATSAGFCIRTLKDPNAITICRIAGIIARPAEDDFHGLQGMSKKTNGQAIFEAYGIRGIRGEAMNGFPTVLTHALPVLRALSETGLHDQNAVHLQTLLHLMTRTEDTNVIARAGLDALQYVRSSAKNALAMGGALTSEGLAELWRMDQAYTQRKISPGGCADLLSVSIALLTIEKLTPDAMLYVDQVHG